LVAATTVAVLRFGSVGRRCPSRVPRLSGGPRNRRGGIRSEAHPPSTVLDRQTTKPQTRFWCSPEVSLLRRDVVGEPAAQVRRDLVRIRRFARAPPAPSPPI